jgi:hypothetical protein
VTISRTLSCARSFALSLSLSLSRARFLLPSLPLCDVKSVCARVQTFVYEAHAYICVRGALTVEQRGEGLAEHVLTILPLRAAPAQCFKLTLTQVYLSGTRVFSVCVCVCVCARARACLCVCDFGLRSMHLSTIDRSPCFSPSLLPSLCHPLCLSPSLTLSLTVSLSPSLSRSHPFSLPFSHALVYAIASEVLLLYLQKGVISPLCHERSDSPALPLSRSPALPLPLSLARTLSRGKY